MRVLRIFVADVARDVELRLALERVAQIERDGIGEAIRRLSRQRPSRLRHDPGEEHGLHHEHRGEEDDQADRDPPVQAFVPMLPLHGASLNPILEAESRIL